MQALSFSFRFSLFLSASDILHWNDEFPHNLRDLKGTSNCRTRKEKILYKTAKDLFTL
jgi:hypothetical protein